MDRDIPARNHCSPAFIIYHFGGQYLRVVLYSYTIGTCCKYRQVVKLLITQMYICMNSGRMIICRHHLYTAVKFDLN